MIASEHADLGNLHIARTFEPNWCLEHYVVLCPVWPLNLLTPNGCEQFCAACW